MYGFLAGAGSSSLRVDVDFKLYSQHGISLTHDTVEEQIIIIR